MPETRLRSVRRAAPGPGTELSSTICSRDAVARKIWEAKIRRTDHADRSRQRISAVPAQLEIARRLFATFAAKEWRRAPRIQLHLVQQRSRARLVGVAGDPHLRLRDVGRHVTDDARHVLVE